MRPFYLASAAFLLSGTVAFASAADMLGDALSKFPHAIVTNPEPVQAYFVNMEALQAIGKEIAAEQGYAAQRLDFAMIDALGPLTMGGVETWKGNAGIDLPQVRYFAGMGVPPQMVSVWGLDSEQTATGMVNSLSDGDFEPVGSTGVFGNGEPMVTNLQAREIGNPWRDQLGRATFVGQSGNALVQSGRPDAVEPFLEKNDAASDHPVVASALASLDEFAEAGTVVQAMLISPAFGLQGADLFSMAPSNRTNLDELRSQLEAAADAAGQGIPPYFGGMIADVQNVRPELVITLVYPDCSIAATAAQMVEKRWVDAMPDSGPALVESATFEGLNGLCAAVVSVAPKQDQEAAVNPYAKALFAKFMRREFNVLQIGKAAE
ncbi:MAG: hypothetical protein ACK4P4_01760 [Allorhizobium sp.]